jgi:hypothetical protein
MRAGVLHWLLPGARLAVLLLAIASASAPAAAEEISLLGGLTDTDDHTTESYAWGLEYRQHLLAHLDASFGYLNEGHIPGHDRDGAVLQLWGNTGPWFDGFSLAFGAGPYAYFDTQSTNTGIGYLDHHGVGLALSGYLSYSLNSHWFASLQLDQLIAPGDIGTRAVMLGIGYRLDSFIATFARSGQDHQSAAVSTAPDEIGLFIGETVINDPSSDHSTTFGVEYRRRATQHVELSASLFDDGEGTGGRHAGVAGEVWVVQEFLSGQIVTGLGLGPYFALQRYDTADGRAGASVVGLASMTFSWRLSRALALRLIWSRGFTGDDQDRDIITAGLAWRF